MPSSHNALVIPMSDGYAVSCSCGWTGEQHETPPLRAHTLGVNEVGINFLRIARERGDEFGPPSWRHEIAHPLNRGRGRARRRLIADAVLS